MEDRFEHIDEVIARILSGEASPQDERLAGDWIALSEENSQAFERSKKIFEQGAKLKPLISVDTDQAWLKVKHKLDEKNTGARVVSIKATPWRSFLRIVAMLVIAAGLGTAGYFLLTARKANDVNIASTDSVRTEELPDGSRFTLNRNSKLSYSSRRYDQKRTVQLEGEAFFDVVHDDKNVFAVQAGGLTIEDVGTSFNVKAYPGDRLILVAVATGEVRIMTEKAEGISLVAGETAEYNTETGTFTKSLNEVRNLAAYKDKIFIFENTELQVIVKLLNEVYASNIVIQNEELKKCRLTASFNNETFYSILEVIAETLNLQVNKTETEIQLLGNGCK